MSNERGSAAMTAVAILLVLVFVALVAYLGLGLTLPTIITDLRHFLGLSSWTAVGVVN